MSALLSQASLGVLFLDRGTRTPIAGMPVYAEASVTVDIEPPMVTLVDVEGADDFILHPVVGPAMRQALANALEDGGFEALRPEQRQKLLEAIREVIGQTQPDIFGLAPEALRIAAAEVVREALARLDLPVRVGPLVRRTWSFPLGFLATDQVGYVSYDLTRLQDLPQLQPPQRAAGNGFQLNVYPMGTEGERLEALGQARSTPESVFAKFEIDRPEFEPDMRILNLPTMQNPSLRDWYLSPGSFATQPEFLLGADGCEALVPSQLSLQEFTLGQVIRLRDTPAGITLPPGAQWLPGRVPGLLAPARPFARRD